MVPFSTVDKTVVLLATSLVVAAQESSAAHKTSVPPARLVLDLRDVGPAYTQNKHFSRSRTLKDAASGDSSRIQRRLRQIWIGGYQTGFNGRSVPWGVVSVVDLFRSSRLADIERAWTIDAIRITGGSRNPVPSNAPGSFRLLVRGTITIGSQKADIDIYMWQRKRAIAAVTVSGSRGAFPSSLVVTLARRQDAKIRRAFS